MKLALHNHKRKSKFGESIFTLLKMVSEISLKFTEISLKFSEMKNCGEFW